MDASDPLGDRPSIVRTSVDDRLTAATLRLPAWIGLALVAAVVAVLTNRPAAPSVRDLGGVWTAEIVAGDGAGQAIPLTLPGLLAPQGVAASSRVLARTEFVAGDGPTAVYVDRPLYALRATVDGATVGMVGDPAREGRDVRSRASLFAILPPLLPGTRHTLGLELRGDYGKGGLTGRILLGPAAEVHATAQTYEVQRVAFALGLSLLATLPLVVAARGAWRPSYVSYGLFATTLALQAVCQAGVADALLPDALAVVRALLFVSPLAAGFGITFVAVFVRGALRGADQLLVAAALALSLLGLGAPPGWLYGLEIADEVLFGVGAAWFGLYALRALEARMSGSFLLLLAVASMAAALATEISLSHGLRSGQPHLLVAGLVFSCALGAAMVLRDAEVSEQHERLLRDSLDAMVIVDREGRVRDTNRAAREQLGVRGAQSPFLEVVSGPERPVVRAHLTRAEARADRAEFRTERGQVFESLATPLGGGLLNLTLRDITARRELDRGLMQAARVETVAMLLGGVAHDFNNMLSTQLAHLGLLRARLTDPWGRDRVDRMEAAVERASDLTRRLLTVARGTGSELVPLDLAQVCAGAMSLVDPTLPTGVRLVPDLPRDLPLVLGAGGDLEQVVVNLLMNARDAVGERGTIRLAARGFRLGRRGRGVALMVEDDGPGISAARKEEIFQPFVSTKRRGTGLGLAVARQILRDHHGRIWAEDRPGGGARFVLALRHVDVVDEAPAPLPDGRRVVLVEDEVVLLEDYERAIAEAGYQVRAFSSSRAAAAWIAENPLDLLVTDVAMPEISGVELARLSIEQHPSAPVLFVSAFVPQESLRDLPDESWHALHKPVRAARLVATVGRIRRRAERQQRGDDEITRVNYLFPDLADLSADDLGFDAPSVADSRP